MSDTPKVCLVLGANGFIGSHIVDELVGTGYAVRAFDRFSNPEQFHGSDGIEIIRGDLYDPALLTDSLKGVDYVFHSFSATTPYSSDNDPVSDVEKNLKPSIKIFELCSQANVKKVVFVSSGGAVYGQIAEERPARESDAATPVSPYGINKLAIEGYLAYFKRKQGLDYLAFRLSNPYGPRQVIKQNQGVIPTFLDNIHQEKKIVLFGDGTSSRDYIYIKDAVSMMARTFALETMHNLYNIGSGKQTTLNQIIETLERILQKKLQVERTEIPKTFLNKAGLDIARFKDEFGVESLTDLEAGLLATVKSG